jgi:DNA-binding MarR family transcriptional regulator
MNTTAWPMPQSTSDNDKTEGNSEIFLELLNVVHENNDLTQRSMANELGIALGLANAYLKRCVRKGYIKVRQIPSNRYSYYLTPTGFTEKSRLAAEFLSSSFNFFRRAKGQCWESLRYASARNWNRVGLVGVGDLAEVYVLCALDHQIDLVGIYDPVSTRKQFAGLRVAKSLSSLGDIDTLIITDTQSPQHTFDQLCNEFPIECILTLPVSGISRTSFPELEEP